MKDFSRKYTKLNENMSFNRTKYEITQFFSKKTWKSRDFSVFYV